MTEPEKSCGTCAFSYYPEGDEREHCSSPDYNSSTYTHDMLMEDWGLGYCRFWTPKKQEVCK